MLTLQDIERFELSDSRICTVLIKSHREALERIETLKKAFEALGIEWESKYKALKAECFTFMYGGNPKPSPIHEIDKLIGIPYGLSWQDTINRIKALVAIEKQLGDSCSVTAMKRAIYDAERDATIERLRAESVRLGVAVHEARGNARLLKILSATYPFIVNKIKKLDAAMKEGAL